MICFLVFGTAWHFLPLLRLLRQRFWPFVCTFLAFLLPFAAPEKRRVSDLLSDCLVAALHYVASFKRFKFNARLLWHQLKIYCIYKSIYYASQQWKDLPSGRAGERWIRWNCEVVVAASHQNCLWVLLYAAAAIFQSALSFLCPLTISIWRQFPSVSPHLISSHLISFHSIPTHSLLSPVFCEHVLEPSEPQLVTNWRLDLIWNVQITNIIKDEQRQFSALSSARFSP